MMVVSHNAHRSLNGLAGFGIGDGAVNAVETLLHITQQAVVVVIPIGGHRRGIGRVYTGTFNGDLAALLVVVHVVLAASANHVPVATAHDAIVEVGHVGRVGVVAGFMDEVGIFTADHFPPCVVGGKLCEVVPRVVHHFGARVEIGGHSELVVLSKIHKPLGFILIAPVAIRVRTSHEVRIMAVEFHIIGVVATRTINGTVAAVVGAVGVGVGADEDVQVVD